MFDKSSDAGRLSTRVVVKDSSAVTTTKMVKNTFEERRFILQFVCLFDLFQELKLLHFSRQEDLEKNNRIALINFFDKQSSQYYNKF